MKAHDLQRYPRFVSHHHFKLESPLLRLEQVQLDRAFPLEGSLAPDKNEPKLPAPALPLQLRESLERNRNREFGSKTIERFHHFIAEKGAVHPNLNDHAR